MRRRPRGFSLVEAMVAIGLAGVIAAALTAGASLLVEPRLRQAVRRAP